MMAFDQPMTLLLPQRDRAFSDLLASEKKLRQEAERDIRDLSGVLSDLAVRLDGTRLEDMRRGNPSIPGNWRAADWRKFFAEVSFLPSSWDTSPMPAQVAKANDAAMTALKEALERVTEERDRARAETKNLRTQLDDLTIQLACSITTEAKPAAPKEARKKPQASEVSAPNNEPEPAKFVSTQPASLSDMVPDQATPPVSNVPSGVIPTKIEMLADLREMQKTLPDVCPSSWIKKMNAGKSEPRIPQDAKKAWRRKASVIYLVGRWGINAKLELEHMVALSEGMNSNSGSLHRALDQIIEGGILESEKMVMSGTNTALKLVRLSKDGCRIYSSLFNMKPIESEWERINRLHEGERFRDHTLSILIFTMHARARGWRSEVLPSVNNTTAVPDLCVCRGDEILYVEVELSNKEYNSKWRNCAEINGGKVALCAANADRRTRLAADCKLLKLAGVSTDIETLKSQSKYEELNEEVPLWIGTWSV